MAIIHGAFSARIPHLEQISAKATMVREAILNSGLTTKQANSWNQGIKTDAQAFGVIDDCLEGDIDPRIDFYAALKQFKQQFKSYHEYTQEVRADYAREYGSPYEI